MSMFPSPCEISMTPKIENLQNMCSYYSRLLIDDRIWLDKVHGSDESRDAICSRVRTTERIHKHVVLCRDLIDFFE